MVSLADSPLPSVAPLGTGLNALPDADAERVTECEDWLRFHRLWGELPERVLRDLAQSLHLLKVPAQTVIYQTLQQSVGVYWVKWGTVAIHRPWSVGNYLIRYRNSGDLFGYVSLMANLEQEQHQTQAVTLSNSEIWFLAKDQFWSLLGQHKILEHFFNTLLAQDLNAFSARIAQEQRRIQGIQSYQSGVPQEETILGSSKVSRGLSEQVVQGAAMLKTVWLQGLPGTGKTFVAGLIHRQSSLADQPFAKLDCAQLPRSAEGQLNTDALFGRVGQEPGILTLLERGTLLLSNVQVLSAADRARLAHYLDTGEVMPNHGIREAALNPPQPVQSWVRLILASPQAPTDFPGVFTIKLFSLSRRKADIPTFARHFVDRWCQEQNRSPLNLDQAGLRRLVSYDYPGNLTELLAILHRAVLMTPLEQSVIAEQVLWSVQSTKNAFRVDLLSYVPRLREFLLSSWYPEGLWWLMMAVFVPVTLAGFVGPQSPDRSITLNLFWAWWWPGYLFLFVFVGRIWCAVCPFMITAEGLRRFSLWLFPRSQRPWPTSWLNRWGAWLLFAGFVAIYLWETLWDLPHHANLSAWLLLLITAGAVVFSLIYERRLWCRYLCPIGGMNGMFAKLSMVELRSAPPVCGSQCHSFGCYKGSGAVPVTLADALATEGQATAGCPLYSHPAQLQNNRDCVLCMTCLKACPNRSVQLNLRFPNADLLDHHQGMWPEVWLLLLLLGGVVLHHHQRLFERVGVADLPLDAAHLSYSLPLACALLSVPALLTYSVHRLSRLLDPEQPSYRQVIYAYLPFTLAVNFAHYVPAAMMEAGQILVVLARSLGLPSTGLPTLTWSADVARFVQELTLLSALVFSIYPLFRITQRSFRSNLLHLLLLLGFVVGGFWLVR